MATTTLEWQTFYPFLLLFPQLIHKCRREVLFSVREANVRAHPPSLFHLHHIHYIHVLLRLFTPPLILESNFQR